MAAYTVNTNADMTSDAAFRVWSKAISDTLALGWTMTSDTGQINFATVTKPGVVSTAAGYNMFRMSDSLQATVPCFLKIEYGCGNSTTYPACWVTVGSATDGAGNLSGRVSSRITLGIQAGGVTVYPSRFSISTNRLCLNLWYGATYNPVLAIERTHDASGADTSAGIMIFAYGWNGSAATVNSQVLLTAGPVTTMNTSYWNTTLPPALTTNAFASDVYLYPVRTWGAGETSPSNQFMVYYPSDLTPQNPLSIKMWDGVYRTMFPLGVTSMAVCYGPTAAYVALAMRYE